MTINCQLLETPVPMPQFAINLTIEVDNDTETLLSTDQNELLVNSEILSLIFEKEAVVNVTCIVSNPIGSDFETSLIRVCGM